MIQPNFQVCLRVEEGSQETSKSSYKYLMWHHFLTCTDARGDVWEDPIMTKSNKDNKSIERRNVGGKPTMTEDGVYKLAFQYYFFITFYFYYEVPQVNVLTQAHDFQINDSIFNSANTVSNWLV